MGRRAPSTSAAGVRAAEREAGRAWRRRACLGGCARGPEEQTPRLRQAAASARDEDAERGPGLLTAGSLETGHVARRANEVEAKSGVGDVEIAVRPEDECGGVSTAQGGKDPLEGSGG